MYTDHLVNDMARRHAECVWVESPRYWRIVGPTKTVAYVWVESGRVDIAKPYSEAIPPHLGRTVLNPKVGRRFYLPEDGRIVSRAVYAAFLNALLNEGSA